MKKIFVFLVCFLPLSLYAMEPDKPVSVLPPIKATTEHKTLVRPDLKNPTTKKTSTFKVLPPIATKARKYEKTRDTGQDDSKKNKPLLVLPAIPAGCHLEYEQQWTAPQVTNEPPIYRFQLIKNPGSETYFLQKNDKGKIPDCRVDEGLSRVIHSQKERRIKRCHMVRFGDWDALHICKRGDGYCDDPIHTDNSIKIINIFAEYRSDEGIFLAYEDKIAVINKKKGIHFDLSFMEAYEVMTLNDFSCDDPPCAIAVSLSFELAVILTRSGELIAYKNGQKLYSNLKIKPCLASPDKETDLISSAAIELISDTGDMIAVGVSREKDHEFIFYNNQDGSLQQESFLFKDVNNTTDRIRIFVKSTKQEARILLILRSNDISSDDIYQNSLPDMDRLSLDISKKNQPSSTSLYMLNKIYYHHGDCSPEQLKLHTGNFDFLFHTFSTELPPAQYQHQLLKKTKTILSAKTGDPHIEELIEETHNYYIMLAIQSIKHGYFEQARQYLFELKKTGLPLTEAQDSCANTLLFFVYNAAQEYKKAINHLMAADDQKNPVARDFLDAIYMGEIPHFQELFDPFTVIKRCKSLAEQQRKDRSKTHSRAKRQKYGKTLKYTYELSDQILSLWNAVTIKEGSFHPDLIDTAVPLTRNFMSIICTEYIERLQYDFVSIDLLRFCLINRAEYISELLLVLKNPESGRKLWEEIHNNTPRYRDTDSTPPSLDQDYPKGVTELLKKSGISQNTADFLCSKETHDWNDNCKNIFWFNETLDKYKKRSSNIYFSLILHSLFYHSYEHALAVINWAEQSIKPALTPTPIKEAYKKISLIPIENTEALVPFHNWSAAAIETITGKKSMNEELANFYANQCFKLSQKDGLAVKAMTLYQTKGIEAAVNFVDENQHYNPEVSKQLIAEFILKKHHSNNPLKKGEKRYTLIEIAEIFKQVGLYSCDIKAAELLMAEAIQIENHSKSHDIAIQLWGKAANYFKDARIKLVESQITNTQLHRKLETKEKICESAFNALKLKQQEEKTRAADSQKELKSSTLAERLEKEEHTLPESDRQTTLHENYLPENTNDSRFNLTTRVEPSSFKKNFLYWKSIRQFYEKMNNIDDLICYSQYQDAEHLLNKLENSSDIMIHCCPCKRAWFHQTRAWLFYKKLQSANDNSFEKITRSTINGLASLKIISMKVKNHEQLINTLSSLDIHTAREKLDSKERIQARSLCSTLAKSCRLVRKYDDMKKLFNFGNTFNPDQPYEKTKQALIEQLNKSKIQVIDTLPEGLTHYIDQYPYHEN